MLLLSLLGISINSYSQILENLGVINSNDYYYSNSYLQSTQTTFIYEFTVSGMRGIHFDFCSSKGITGTRVWLLDKNSNIEDEITEKCSNNGLVSSALNLSGAYKLTIDVVSQQPKWEFSINLYSSIAISVQWILYPIREPEELYDTSLVHFALPRLIIRQMPAGLL